MKGSAKMYTFEYKFYPDLTKIDIMDYYDEKISWFLSSLLKNGQLLDQHDNIVQVGESLMCFCLAFEEDSLDVKYYNKYCSDYLSQLIDVSKKPPEYKLIGKSVGLSNCCSCQEHSYYILFATSCAFYSPIMCGDCNLPMPLYKFPKIDDEIEYSNIIYWEAKYQAFDSLFMLTDIGEKYGYQQISNIKSKLSIEGLKICVDMAKLTGKPFYYFIHKYYSPQKNHCPKCGTYWKLDKALHGLYTHKCDNCLILSDSP